MAQQPGPGVAEQGCVVDMKDRILSRLKGQALTTNHTIRAFRRIADYRAADKHDPHYYARHTVTKALNDLPGTRPAAEQSKAQQDSINERAQGF
jgi:hypothetical protein